MGKRYGIIKVELRSDLCAGSGYSYAGVIDSDVVYDACGIPQIPARRLKGCMREAAELVCPADVEALFGKTGDDGVRGIVLGNAYIENYEAVTEELRRLRGTGRDEEEYLSSQSILERYTQIRAQTKINEETGTAEKNMLRYTRVVGQYDPRKERKNLCFYAEVEYEEIYREKLERIVKAVRNLGMNRNRGLGSVRCSLIEGEESGKKETVTGQKAGEERVCLTYVIHNREPLLMSSDNVGISDSHISGKSILGTLAGAYLRMEGKTAESEAFRNLFLDGSTLFTDANITFPPEKGRESAVSWPDYYPAPLYLNRLKKSKVLVNLLAKDRQVPEKEADRYDVNNGNQPKKLKTHYVHEAEQNTYDVVETDREIVYHNSRTKELYSLEAIAEGQYFRGCIYTDRKYAGLLKYLLETTRLSFGKSRTAQYGACELAAEIKLEEAAEIKLEEAAKQEFEFSIEAGERVAVVFRSDAVFLSKTGYTVQFEEVKELAVKQLGIPYDKTKEEGSILQTKEITGYNTTWNLRRPGVPGVKAGSVLVYTIPAGSRWCRDLRPDKKFVGEGNQEGYGQIEILECKKAVYAARQIKDSTGKEKENKVLTLEHNRSFLLSILTEQLLERLVFLYITNNSKLGLTASTVGRLDLMLRESLNGYRDDPEEAFKDFGSRVASIKREKEKEEAFRLLDRLMRRKNKNQEINELDLAKMTEDRRDETLGKTEKLLAAYCTQEEYRKRLAGIWGVYLEQILTYHKYRKKHEGGSNDDGK